MSKNYKVYPYGFLLSTEKSSFLPNYYKHKTILDTFHYYYDEYYGLNYFELNNKFILIHGHYQHVSVNKEPYGNKDLLRQLLNIYSTNHEEFLNILDYIGGRYCIMIGDQYNFEVFQDASGARSIYYALDSNVISSHANLINEIIPCVPFEYSKKSTYPRFSFNNSPFENVKALVPNFKLNFKNKNIERFFPRESNKYKSLNDVDKVDLVADLWQQQLYNYQKNYKNLLISLTGGNDSRISLALSKNYKNQLQYFTYCKNPSNLDKNIKRELVNEKDRQIVEQILEDISINHKFIYYDEEDLKIPSDLDSVLSKNSIAKHGRFLLNLYLLNFPDNNMHLRGTCLEIVQSVYVDPSINSNNEAAVLDRYLFTAEKYFNQLSKDQFKKVGETGIQELGYNKTHYDFHLLDLYYWEHRMGRWHPELLNETDVAFDTFLPFNLRAILEIGMSFSIKKRQSGYLFKELINNSFPILNFFGVNNRFNIYEQNRKQLNGLEKNASKSQQPYFKYFSIHNQSGENLVNISTKNNTLKVPVEYLSTDNYSQAQYTFSSTLGSLELVLLSAYKNDRAYGHLQYEILVNSEVILIEDMAKWEFPNNLNILNLENGDIITIRVRVLKGMTRKSWEAASNLIITKLKEYPLEKKFNNTPKVTHTSPFSINY